MYQRHAPTRQSKIRIVRFFGIFAYTHIFKFELFYMNWSLFGVRIKINTELYCRSFLKINSACKHCFQNGVKLRNISINTDVAKNCATLTQVWDLCVNFIIVKPLLHILWGLLQKDSEKYFKQKTECHLMCIQRFCLMGSVIFQNFKTI